MIALFGLTLVLQVFAHQKWENHMLIKCMYGGFLKWEYPKIIHLNGIVHYFGGTTIYAPLHRISYTYFFFVVYLCFARLRAFSEIPQFITFSIDLCCMCIIKNVNDNAAIQQVTK